VRLEDIWLEDAAGERLTNIEHGARFGLCTELEALGPIDGISVGFSIVDADGTTVCNLSVILERGGEVATLEGGERVTVRAEIENLLLPGRYFVHLGVNRAPGAMVALYVNSAVDFVVFGGEAHVTGLVSLPHEIEALIEDRAEQGSAR
jgi:hypothetical protein